jgi:hypothetical protein
MPNSPLPTQRPVDATTNTVGAVGRTPAASPPPPQPTASGGSIGGPPSTSPVQGMGRSEGVTTSMAPPFAPPFFDPGTFGVKLQPYQGQTRGMGGATVPEGRSDPWRTPVNSPFNASRMPVIETGANTAPMPNPGFGAQAQEGWPAFPLPGQQSPFGTPAMPPDAQTTIQDLLDNPETRDLGSQLYRAYVGRL